ncbi:MAG: NAD(P)H-dependent oxidoreductase subunit E [Verrucomicrobia bacterium]|nr:NAD(P)H-dependent oxidoreductase subunit E [Verrucomicrobiota bacterium]
MSMEPPADLEAEIDALISRYPHPRSAVLMVLHALQERFGFISPDALEWTARKLGLQPINVWELVTFYPMFRQQPQGRFHLKLCRTLGCALAGSHELHAHLCGKLGLDPRAQGPQTTPDGMFTIEFVECLAACDAAPVMMCNDALHERVSLKRAEAIVDECQLAARHGFEP